MPQDDKRIDAVYHDERFTLGLQDGEPCLTADGKTYRLSCHPFEPCLYITGADGRMTVVHNAFDPCQVIEAVRSGQTFTSITGRRYDARAFCRLAASCAGAGEINIDSAERVFREQENDVSSRDSSPVPPAPNRSARMPEGCTVADDDPFCALIAAYPDSAVDCCAVRDSLPYCGIGSHRRALEVMCRTLWDDPAGDGWRYDVDRARATPITAEELLAEHADDRLTLHRAFLDPPGGNGYSESDWERVKAALFPCGTEDAEILEWSTDWSDYFDDGHEWWGVLCLTIYDKKCLRTVVITASATD